MLLPDPLQHRVIGLVYELELAALDILLGRLEEALDRLRQVRGNLDDLSTTI